MTSLRIYGIANCDTVKKALAFLAGQGIAFDFIDFKKQGVPPGPLAAWTAALGWQALLNRKGTTWRQLAEPLRADAVDATSATRLMIEHPSLIKRPVVEWPGGRVTVGFDAADWSRRL